MYIFKETDQNKELTYNKMKLKWHPKCKVYYNIVIAGVNNMCYDLLLILVGEWNEYNKHIKIIEPMKIKQDALLQL